MSPRISVCYGKPTDEAAFDDYYTRVHMPLAKAVPGLTRFTFGKVSSLDGTEPPYYAVAGLYFADAETMQTGLRSPEMRAAGADVQNFATGGATMFVADEHEFDL
ncbi:EthD family reductase [Gordonia McavH-238-E]|uniref:EthD family reductase n=1 Tax=Gordonia sp. McavH-238-E TaxID=2917736 RepID=UPI001EF496B4|nr:EthD family reductase [Gordonia sp. McavH-238-E]MCG7632890.1 EthD family reductase [Gordonia sp. McavH-238-E]